MKTLNHRFVENVPDQLEEGVLYISIPFETVIHKCCCGCGNEVVTPLSPAAWGLIFNGETVSLNPSIGNWSFDCKSHYWIKKNKVHWSYEFDEEKIERVKQKDLRDNQLLFDKKIKANTDKSIKIESSKKLESKKWYHWLFNIFK